MQYIAFSIYIMREQNCHCNQQLFRITHSADSSTWCRMIGGTCGQFDLTLNAVKDHQKTEEKSNERILVINLFFSCYSYRFWKLRTRPSWRLPTIYTFMRSSYVLLKYSSLLGKNTDNFCLWKHTTLLDYCKYIHPARFIAPY